MAILEYTCIPHAAWIPRQHSDPAEDLLGLAAVRYYRFDRNVRVDQFRLCPKVLRFEPTAYTRPEHLTFARYVDGHGWEIFADVHLPVIEPDAWHDITLDGVVTDHLRVVCDWEHPAEACHGDFSYAPWNVPFSILEQVEFLGEPLTETRYEPPYAPILQVVTVAPSAPAGMSCTMTPHEVRFRSPSFQVAFSLQRPLITHLAWDVTGAGLVDRSLVCLDSRLARRFHHQWPTDLACGPWYAGLREEASCLYWGGEVSVDGHRVRYRSLQVIEGLTLDVEFVVHANGLDVHLYQCVARDLSASEYEAWRFYWNAEEAITATLAMPVGDTGRGGPVSLPAFWNGPGHGALQIQQVSGNPVLLQVDSVRQEHYGMAGFLLGVEHDAYGYITLPRGEYRASLTIRTCDVLPTLVPDVPKQALPVGIRRNWVTPMAFRPEQGGFSSNAMSSGGLMCMEVLDLCAATALPEASPPLLEMARYTVRVALQGGPGYGENRELFQDTDLALISAAGRLHQAAPDLAWLMTVLPTIEDSTRRVLGKIDEHGLYLCRALSGNAGSGGWSCNLWDVVSFGHYDAYGNAFCYRALQNAAALLADAGDTALADQCQRAARNLKTAYAPCFMNPATGWLAGWRSRDGQLHDYAFTFINGMAICFGLVEGEQARDILARLEAQREAIGFRDFHFGLPPNLLSIQRDDVPTAQQGRRADSLDMFGIYLNGCATTYFLEYYLDALSHYGFTDTADAICRDLEESLASNRLVGGVFSGTEFFTWQGAPCGYEGILEGQFRVLLSIVQHRGWVSRFTPAWWAIPDTTANV